MLAFRHCYVTMSIERPIIKKKSYVTCKKPLSALCEKRLQSSMFKWTSFYNFLEFHCKILNSYAIYRCKKMVKILNCYLHAKKNYGTLSKGALFLANVYNDAQSWTALFRAFSSHRQPSASLTKLFPSWTRLLEVEVVMIYQESTTKDVKLVGRV